MKLDLRKDFQTICKHVEQRVRDYPVYVNSGPGKDSGSIALITLGFQMDQAGWVALVFDTRPDAEFDGEWQSYIEENAIDFNHWYEAFDELAENRSKIAITLHDGSKKTLGKDDDGEKLAECFGAMLRDVLIAAKTKRQLEKLPLLKDCQIAVEDHDGLFGWCAFLDGRASGESANEDALKEQVSNVAKLSKPEQIQHWIGQLDLLAKGTTSGFAEFDDDIEFAVKKIAKCGDSAVVPLLEFACKWAGKPEFKGDGKGSKELPMQTVTLNVLWKLQEMGVANPKVESLLCEIVRKSIKANEKRTLWGVLPHHAARTLNKLFDGYPEPKIRATSNRLVNDKCFLGGNGN